MLDIFWTSHRYTRYKDDKQVWYKQIFKKFINVPKANATTLGDVW